MLALAGCSRAPDEQRLREAIETMHAAAEAREPSGVVEWVSRGFVGSHGLDRDRLRALLRAQMLRHRAIGVTLGPLGIELGEDGEATVRFVAVTTGGSGALVPDSARAYRVLSRWRIEDGEWRVYAAEWEAES